MVEEFAENEADFAVRQTIIREDMLVFIDVHREYRGNDEGRTVFPGRHVGRD